MNEIDVTKRTMEKIEAHRRHIEELKVRMKNAIAVRDIETVCISQDQMNFEVTSIAVLYDTDEMMNQEFHWKKVSRNVTDGSIYLIEYFYGSRPVALVEARAPHYKFGSLAPAEINWKSCGAQQIDFAKVFVYVLKDAVQDTELLNEGKLK